MINLSFAGTYVRNVSRQTLAEQILSEFKITVLDDGRQEKFDELVKTTGIQPDEVVVYFKEEAGIVLFFNEAVPTDWMEILAKISTIENPNSNVSMKRFIVGQFDLKLSKGFLQSYIRGSLSTHITKFSNVLKFPVYASDVPQEEKGGSLEKWINDECSLVMGVPIINELYRKPNSDKRVTVFKFDPLSLAALKTTLSNQDADRKQNNLTLFRAYVESRASTSAAFESNKNDKVIYQFLSNDYTFTNYSNFTCNHIGKHPDLENVIQTFLTAEPNEIAALIEEFAREDINFYGLFDLVFYTGLYHTHDRVRANALALAMLLNNGSFRSGFWSEWKKDFYTKQNIIASVPNSSTALYYTNLLKHKYSEAAPEAVADTGAKISAPTPPQSKTLVIDSNASGLEGNFLKYFEEVIVRDQERLVNHEVYNFFNTLVFYGSTIKSLALINCSLQKLHDGLEKMSLTKLDVSGNPLSSIDKIHFSTLEELVIRNTPLEKISLKGLPALKKIVVADSAALGRIHLTDIEKLRPDFYFEVSATEDGSKKYFNFKKQEVDPFKAIPKKSFWKVW